MKKITIILAIGFLQLTVFSQIPTIKAIGGDGTYVDWPQDKINSKDEEGPGFFGILVIRELIH